MCELELASLVKKKISQFKLKKDCGKVTTLEFFIYLNQMREFLKIVYYFGLHPKPTKFMVDHMPKLYRAWEFLRDGAKDKDEETLFDGYKEALYEAGRFSTSFKRGMPKDVAFKTTIGKLSILPFVTQVYTAYLADKIGNDVKAHRLFEKGYYVGSETNPTDISLHSWFWFQESEEENPNQIERIGDLAIFPDTDKGWLFDRLAIMNKYFEIDRPLLAQSNEIKELTTRMNKYHWKTTSEKFLPLSFDMENENECGYEMVEVEVEEEVMDNDEGEDNNNDDDESFRPGADNEVAKRQTRVVKRQVKKKRERKENSEQHNHRLTKRQRSGKWRQLVHAYQETKKVATAPTDSEEQNEQISTLEREIEDRLLKLLNMCCETNHSNLDDIDNPTPEKVTTSKTAATNNPNHDKDEITALTSATIESKIAKYFPKLAVNKAVKVRELTWKILMTTMAWTKDTVPIELEIDDEMRSNVVLVHVKKTDKFTRVVDMYLGKNVGSKPTRWMTTLVADLKNWANNGWTNSIEWSEEDECYNDPQVIAIMNREYDERLHELVDKKMTISDDADDEVSEAARSMLGLAAEDKDGSNASSNNKANNKEAADIPDDD